MIRSDSGVVILTLERLPLDDGVNELEDLLAILGQQGLDLA
jgi:hypothetical protein